MLRIVSAVLLVVALASCRGCSSLEDAVQAVLGGAKKEDPGAFDREFLAACRKQGEEAYCACMLREIRTRFDEAQLKQASDALDRGELPPPAVADAADACGADGDAIRVGRPFKREVEDAILAACRPRYSEGACTCIVEALERNYALVQVHDGIKAFARGEPVFGPVSDVANGCQRADFERQQGSGTR